MESEKLVDLKEIEHFLLIGEYKKAEKLIIEKEESKLEKFTPIGINRLMILKSRLLNAKGEFNQSIKITDKVLKKLEKETRQPLEDRLVEINLKIDALNEQTFSLIYLGKLEEGLVKLEKGFKELEKLEQEEIGELRDDYIRKSYLINNRGEISRRKGELNEALDYYNQSLLLREKAANRKEISASLNSIGSVYFLKGELDQALDFFKRSLVIREKIGNKQNIASSLNNVGLVHRRNGEFELALDYYKQSLLLREEVGNKLEIAGSVNNIGTVYSRIGEFDQSLFYYKKALVIREEIGNKQDIAASLNNIGIVYHDRAELIQALDFYNQALKLYNQIGNEQDISMCLNNIGELYEDKGELDQALTHYQRSLAIRKKIGNTQNIADSLDDIGEIYRHKGELDQALDFHKQSLAIREEAGNKQDIAGSKINIGEIYEGKGELNQALDCYKQSLVLREAVGNKLWISDSLFHLIHAAIDQEELVQKYLNKLELINKQEELKLVDLRYRLARALLQKRSNRTRIRANSERILIEIVDEEVLEHRLTVLALLGLCELLLIELNSSGDEEVLEEVEKYLNKLLEIAKKQNSSSLLTESYWLKAQLALVKLDVKEARKLFAKSQLLAEEKGLKRLAIKISNDYDRLIEQLDYLEELIEKDVSIQEKLKIAKIEESFSRMSKRRIVDEELIEDEKPISLLIVYRSGIPIFTKHFGKDKEINDLIISAFLTSFNITISNFMSEAIMGETQHTRELELPVERMKYKEHTITLKYEDPVLFIYIFKGASYGPLQKLNNFKEAICHSEIWETIKEIGLTGERVEDVNEKIEDKVNEIF
ncbi:MAG: tetratricopeptide repeat protein [Candidatus Kariarchaeaceae archaeon]